MRELETTADDEDDATSDDEDAAAEDEVNAACDELCMEVTVDEEDTSADEERASEEDGGRVLLESGAAEEDGTADVPPAALMLEESTLLAEDPGPTEELRLLDAVALAPDPREDVVDEVAAELVLPFTFPELVSPLETHTSPLQVVPLSQSSGCDAQDRAQVPLLHEKPSAQSSLLVQP